MFQRGLEDSSEVLKIPEQLESGKTAIIRVVYGRESSRDVG